MFGITEILYSFRLVLEGKTGKEIPESSRLEFLEKFLANNFALSDAEDNTSGSLNRAGIADLPLLRTLLAIHQKSHERSFLELSFMNPDSANYVPFTENPGSCYCNWTRTHNHLVHKRTLNHLAKLAKRLSCVVSTYLYGAFDCMFLSCHVRVSE